jgi:hypothetical protein
MASAADIARAPGNQDAQDGLVGVASATAGTTPSTTVRARGCGVTKFLLGDGQNPGLSFVDGVELAKRYFASVQKDP